MSHRALACLVVLIAISLVRPAWACSCVQISPKDMMEKADVVFVGEVVSREKAPEYGWRYTFKVQRKYKGVTAATLTVATGLGGGDCGFDVPSGTRMFVYASQREGSLTTNICMRTARLESATEDLKAHGEGEAVKQ